MLFEFLVSAKKSKEQEPLPIQFTSTVKLFNLNRSLN